MPPRRSGGPPGSDRGAFLYLGNEGQRVLFTFIRIGIAVIIMLIANLLEKRTASTTPQTT